MKLIGSLGSSPLLSMMSLVVAYPVIALTR